MKIQKYILIEEKANPSTDFYIQPYLQSNNIEFLRFRLSDKPPSLTGNDKVSVIFVRYINNDWKNWIEHNLRSIESIFFFMDDDMLDLSAHKQLPLRYRHKLFNATYRHRKWLKKHASLWVSTQYLAEKYSELNPVLLSPVSPYRNMGRPVTVFYHGSASHIEEYRWLYPVLEEVVNKNTNICIELIADKKIRKLYSGLANVNLLHPMNWQSYQLLISRGGRDIGLAPLLDTPFNKARSSTRFYDITACGASGIFADHPAYNSVVKHEENGLLLPMDPDKWVHAILNLSENAATRQNLYECAQSSVL